MRIFEPAGWLIGCGVHIVSNLSALLLLILYLFHIFFSRIFILVRCRGALSGRRWYITNNFTFIQKKTPIWIKNLLYVLTKTLRETATTDVAIKIYELIRLLFWQLFAFLEQWKVFKMKLFILFRSKWFILFGSKIIDEIQWLKNKLEIAIAFHCYNKKNIIKQPILTSINNLNEKPLKNVNASQRRKENKKKPNWDISRK